MILVQTSRDGKVIELYKGNINFLNAKLKELTIINENKGIMLIHENSHSNEFADSKGWHSALSIADGWVTKVSH